MDPVADLHTHTYYSDGRSSPLELVEAAAARGLRWLAISDHDNARGSREARPAALQRGIELIPAMEFSTAWPEAHMPPGASDVDVLGYFIDIDAPLFRQVEEAALADQHRRIAVWCELLRRGGVDIAVADLLEINPRYPGNLQLSKALRARGYSAEAVDQLLVPLLPEIPPARLTTAEAFEVIHALGGVAVLAHPARDMVSWQGELLDERAVGRLAAMGLDGLEAYHFRLDAATREHFLALARQFGLLVSGGSDEHGWQPGFPYLGKQPVTEEIVRAMAERAQGKRPG